jgi:hypothetical protein
VINISIFYYIWKYPKEWIKVNESKLKDTQEVVYDMNIGTYDDDNGCGNYGLWIRKSIYDNLIKVNIKYLQKLSGIVI